MARRLKQLLHQAAGLRREPLRCCREDLVTLVRWGEVPRVEAPIATELPMDCQRWKRTLHE
jgi:hypothetical protein